MVGVALPIHEAIRDLTSDLLGRGTAVDTGLALEGKSVAAVATYRTNDGTLAVVAEFDQDIVLILGGALTLIPRAMLDEARVRNEVPANIVDNFWEVANILSSILNRAGSPHLALAEHHRSLEGIALDVRSAIDAPVRSRAFNLTVDGYGVGAMALFAV